MKLLTPIIFLVIIMIAGCGAEIEKKEIFENLNNGQELLQIGKFCKLSSENLGAVPLFYSDEKCYIGSDEVMNFFKNKLNLSSS